VVAVLKDFLFASSFKSFVLCFKDIREIPEISCFFGSIETSVLRIEKDSQFFIFQVCVIEQISMLILIFKYGNNVSDFDWGHFIVLKS
jgi:hypothetical protein